MMILQFFLLYYIYSSSHRYIYILDMEGLNNLIYTAFLVVHILFESQKFV